MKALILSALALDVERGPAALAALHTVLAERGHSVDTVDVVTADIIPCTGCGSCGLKTPGVCVVRDGMQEVLRLLVASDVLVLATPVRFGSYCAQLKKVIDRFQPLMMPIYVVRGGEMHFRGRYEPMPSVLGVGTTSDPDEAAAFRFLLGRLALNLDTTQTAVILDGDDGEEARHEVERALLTLAGAAR
jgi:multimeric flavodoxin WrbA